jgi:hypothetical protein
LSPRILFLTNDRGAATTTRRDWKWLVPLARFRGAAAPASYLEQLPRIFTLLFAVGCATTNTSWIDERRAEGSKGGESGSPSMSPDGAGMAVDAGVGAPVTAPRVDAGTPGGSDDALRCTASIDNAGSSSALPMPEVLESPVRVLFPPRFSYTDAAVLTVRGSSSQGSGVAGVSVNGVSASSEDGFRSWHAQVPVAPGINEFNVAILGSSGVTTPAGGFVVSNNGSPLLNIDALDYDPDTGSIFVSDFRLSAILTLDTATGRVASLVDPSGNNGSETDFFGSQSIAIDSSHNRILTFSWGEDVVLGIDQATGDRTVISSNAERTGPASLAFASGIALDAIHQRAFALATPNIVVVDLASGLRTPLGASVDTDGLPVGSLNDLVYDDVSSIAAPRLLVSDTHAHAILAVDATTGERTTFSGDGTAGPALEQPGRLKLDAARGRLLVVDGMDSVGGQTGYLVNRAALVAVNLGTGARTTLADAVTGSGFLPTTPYALALDERNARAYVANDWNGEIAEIDLLGGARRLITHSNVGSGRHLRGATGLARGTSGQGRAELIVADGLSEALVQIDPSTGNRTELSSPCLGSGPSLGYPVDVIVEDEANTPSRSALVLDASRRAIFRVDLATGDRSELSGPAAGDGPPLGVAGVIDLRSLALDSEHGRLLVTRDSFGSAPSWLYAVDPATGNRTLLSSSTRGDGPALPRCNGIVLNSSTPGPTTEAFVLFGSGVARVNLESGDRSLFSSSTPVVGTGVRIDSPQRGWLDVTGGMLFASTDSGIVSVNLADASRGLVSDSDILGPLGGGPPLDLPGALQGDLDGGPLYVVDGTYGAVFAVDRVSGDRVLFSR